MCKPPYYIINAKLGFLPVLLLQTKAENIYKTLILFADILSFFSQQSVMEGYEQTDKPTESSFRMKQSKSRYRVLISFALS